MQFYEFFYINFQDFRRLIVNVDFFYLLTQIFFLYKFETIFLHPKLILKLHMRFLPKTPELSFLSKSFTEFFLLYVKDSSPKYCPRNRVHVSVNERLKHLCSHLREWVEFSAVLFVPVHSQRWILLLANRCRRLHTTALLLKSC
jgi:hypothetical protein